MKAVLMGCIDKLLSEQGVPWTGMSDMGQKQYRLMGDEIRGWN